MVNSSGVAMAGEQRALDRSGWDDLPALPAREDMAEAKRLAARRRFLLGGAAAVSSLITANRANAQSTWSDCATKYNVTFLLPNFLKGSVFSPVNCDAAMQQLQQMQENPDSQPVE
jgi:hypothetical protein